MNRPIVRDTPCGAPPGTPARVARLWAELCERVLGHVAWDPAALALLRSALARTRGATRRRERERTVRYVRRHARGRGVLRDLTSTRVAADLRRIGDAIEMGVHELPPYTTDPQVKVTARDRSALVNAAAERERRAVLRWLRAYAERLGANGLALGKLAVVDAADSIERADHFKPDTDASPR